MHAQTLRKKENGRIQKVMDIGFVPADKIRVKLKRNGIGVKEWLAAYNDGERDLDKFIEENRREPKKPKRPPQPVMRLRRALNISKEEAIEYYEFLQEEGFPWKQYLRYATNVKSPLPPQELISKSKFQSVVHSAISDGSMPVDPKQREMKVKRHQRAIADQLVSDLIELGHDVLTNQSESHPNAGAFAFTVHLIPKVQDVPRQVVKAWLEYKLSNTDFAEVKVE